MKVFEIFWRLGSKKKKNFKKRRKEKHSISIFKKEYFLFKLNFRIEKLNLKKTIKTIRKKKNNIKKNNLQD